jgi:hypothetical protein
VRFDLETKWQLQEAKTKLLSKNDKLQKLHEKNIKKYAPSLNKLAQ